MNAFPRAGRPSVPAMLFVITSLVLLAASSSPGAETPNANETQTASPTATLGATATAEASETPEATPEPTPGVGVKILVGDQQYVTVTVVEQWLGTDTIKPAAGSVFVTTNIRIDAITTTDFTSADFTVKDAAGTTYQETPGRSPRLSFQNGLAPNTYYAGFVTFEVPAAAAGELTLVYSPNFLTTTYETKLY